MTHSGEPGDVSSNSQFASSGALPLSPVPASPPMRNPNRPRGDSGSYYEDVDPRFAVDDSAPPPALTPGGMPPGAISQGIPGGYPVTPGAYNGQRMPPPSTLPAHPPPPPAPPTHTNPDYLHPSSHLGAGPAAAPGAGANDPSSPRSDAPPHLNSGSFPAAAITPTGSSQEDLPEGARSPAQGSERASEASHFTSISQRPVNPHWRPPGGGGGPIMGSTFAPPSSASAAQRRREDVILNGNPDFSIPGVGRGGRGGGRGGRGARGSVPPSVGLTPGGRYPTDL